MPSSPDTTHYLNEREKSIAVMRIAANKSGIHDPHFKGYQCKEAFLDVRLYLFFFAFVSVNISNGGISIYATQIINAFGFDKPQSALLDMSKGLAEVVAVVIGTLMFMLWKRRDVPCLFGYMVAIVGGVMMSVLDASHKVTRVAGLSLLYFFPISYPMFYSWMNGCVSGTTKRIIFNAGLQVAYCVGNIIGPQIYPSDSQSDYTTATTVDYVMFAVSAMFVLMLTFVHYVWNCARDRRGLSVESMDPEEQIAADLSDKTDKERASYRYPY